VIYGMACSYEWTPKKIHVITRVNYYVLKYVHYIGSRADII
jgi:hypothetical protein